MESLRSQLHDCSASLLQARNVQMFTRKDASASEVAASSFTRKVERSPAPDERVELTKIHPKVYVGRAGRVSPCAVPYTSSNSMHVLQPCLYTSTLVCSTRGRRNDCLYTHPEGREVDKVMTDAWQHKRKQTSLSSLRGAL
eukprot:2266520-Amphidinium_carterae.1